MFHLYGLIIGIGAVAGWSVAEKIEPRVNKVLPWVLAFGIVGARLYHVIDQWAYYSQNWIQIFEIWHGGMGIFGGIIGGAVGVWIYFKGETQKAGSVIAAIVTGLPLAQAIGRWGNLVNNELWGKNHEPLFLYESILDLILFAILWRIRVQGSSRKIVGTYLLGYGVIRLILESFKPSPWWVGYLVASIFVVSGAVMSYNGFNKLSKRGGIV